MRPEDWHVLLARETAPWSPTSWPELGPSHSWSARRGPACAERLTALCARLGIEGLPPSYESFLATHDGGWIGDRYVYGIPELELLFPPGFSRGADEAFLLPFHPVDRFGIECFAIPAAASSHEANVLWCRDDATVTLPHHDAIHPLAEAIVRGRRPELCEATYVDFTDWALDALDEARRGTGVAWCAGVRDN